MIKYGCKDYKSFVLNSWRDRCIGAGFSACHSSEFCRSVTNICRRISGLRDTDTDDIDDDSSYDDFIDRLQESVAEDDAIIILEAGSEKMRYIIGSATIITSSGFKYMDITDLAVAQAAEMIGNSMWETKCVY